MFSINEHNYDAFFEKCRNFIEEQVSSKHTVSNISQTESIPEAYFLLAFQVYKLKAVFNNEDLSL